MNKSKSVIVDKGETLVNCLAYIDLKPLRAGLVDRPEDYRWNSLGYHLQTQNKNQFLISRFRYRTRNFTDSGIIGSKEFVSENYQRFKHLFYSKHEKKPKPIKGLDGMYSLKRLSELM
jgi:putative transposase